MCCELYFNKAVTKQKKQKKKRKKLNGGSPGEIKTSEANNTFKDINKVNVFNF